MEHTPEELYIGLRSALRFIIWTLNNLYCIPVHFCWLFLLQPLKWISEDNYWMVEGIMFRWLLSMVCLWSYSAGYHIVEVGDNFLDLIDERTLVLFNHQSTADVPLIMAAFSSRVGLSNNIMWIMDHVFKLTNFGLVSVAHGDFFIHGGPKYRDASLLDLSSHLADFYIPRKRRWLVLFPEGGFLKNKIQASHRYSEKNNLPKLNNVAYPRIGALKVIMDAAAASHQNDGTDKIKYLLDVTVAYPGGRPLDLQTIFGGWRPSCDTIFYYRKYGIEEVPRDRDDLESWLFKRYQEKEEILQEYYNTGTFPNVPTPHSSEHQPENVVTLPRSRVVHDPIDFILRHCFYIASTWIWLQLLYWIFSILCRLLW
ncbi:Acyl-CoA:lysophosphatidylglycerol acyltransferase 1 [Halocaridina rubra]|uniref:Acyl-CoA:lysophosphatidylglycerol acyltransferase 1 n=1 Tax=Halocaridina rubra TaxID=373956 RepID=A0AAN8WKJ9_HALRR